LFGGDLSNRFGGAVECNGTLVALQAQVLPDLQEEGTVSEGEAAVHTFSAAYTEIVVNNVLEIGPFHFPTRKGIGRAHLVFCSCVPCKKLWVEKAGAKITIAAQCPILETLDRRNQFGTSVGTDAAPDTFVGINLPNERITGNFLLTGEQTGGTG